MEEAKKKANDPASQAQMKELQAKMDDPQFKQMLESNPDRAAMRAFLTGYGISKEEFETMLPDLKALSIRLLL